MRERELLKSARNYVEAVATSGKVGSVFAKNLLVEIDEYLQKPLPESKPQEFDLLQEDPVERQQFDEIVSRLNINPLVAVKDALATMHKCAEYPQGSYAKMLAIYSNEIAKAVFVSKDPSSARIAIYTEPPAREQLTDDDSWKEFDCKTPLQGVYWVCGTYPDYDVDVDDYGKIIGDPSRENINYVALVNIDFDPNKNYLNVEPINEFETGRCDDDYGISYYMEFKIPKHCIKEQK